MDAGARCNETPANATIFRLQALTKCRPTVYDALPEDDDRHENILFKNEDIFRVQTGGIHGHCLVLGGALLPSHLSLFVVLRVAFVLNMLDLVNEELPGVLGVREMQGVLHRPMKISLPFMVILR